MEHGNLDEILCDAYLESQPEAFYRAARAAGWEESVIAARWRWFAAIGESFRAMPVPEPSPIVINRLLAHAREQAQRPRFSFANFFLRPAQAFGGLAAALVAGFVGWQVWFSGAPLATSVAQQQAPVMAPQVSVSTNVVPQSRAMAPFVLPGFSLPESSPSNSRRFQLSGPGAFAAPVSFGDTSGRLAEDDVLDRKMMSQTLLDEHDLDAVFFRARKAERQGYYDDALKDYRFITKFYPGYPNLPSVRLAVANCQQALNDKDAAITTLEDFESRYGNDQNIEQWIDDLKSESF